jgi:maleylacetoacetate isomerase
MAIMEYLNEVYPNPNLYPGTPVERSRIRAFCEMINSGVHPFQNLRVLDKIDEYKANKLEWCVYWTTRGMRTFETMLEREKAQGKYCFGD